MSINSRLTALEKSLGGDGCPHDEIYVWFGDDGADPNREHIGEPPESVNCRECGLPAMLLVVQYDSKKLEVMK